MSEGNQQNNSGFVEVPSTYQLRHPSTPHLQSLDEYHQLYQKSIASPGTFWSDMATSLLHWETPFYHVQHGTFEKGDHAWFLGGKLNACYNCVDRHAMTDPDKVAIIYECDTPDEYPRHVTYGELLRDTCQLSWVLKNMGVQKGDIITVYMPNICEAIVAMLACARIGAIHSAVFAGFSAPALRGRIEDARSKVVLTVDESVRGGKVIPMKRIVDEALSTYDKGYLVQRLVLKKTGSSIPWSPGDGDRWWHIECAQWPTYIAPEPMDSENPLYLLYTSGSTGKPKGLLHSIAGYLLGCAVTGKYVLDLHPSDTMFCAGDVGWITGNSYLVYAPLVCGVTTVIFEGTPSFPDYDRYWDILDRNGVTHFYTAPTALRMMKKARPDGVSRRLDRLRVIACIGEPLAPNIWEWCYETVGRKQVHILDTYFQTETGCHAFSPLAGISPIKPGTVALPFFGINPALIDLITGEELEGNDTKGVLAFKQPWPSMARTVWGDHSRYLKTYFEVYCGYYTTGDAAYRDQDGYYQVLGRVDDVVNVSGHRLSTAEIESALLDHGSFSEVAVVGIPDDITGQALNVFSCLKDGVRDDKEQLKTSSKQQIGNVIGRFAVPKRVFIMSDLPKTRSGKIMRRILRKVLEGERQNFGDTSTLIRPDSVNDLINEIESQAEAKETGPDTQKSPHPFEPYNLTPLDHILPPCHMFMFLTFNNHSDEGIETLKKGVSQLNTHLPFLTGVVAPSSQSAGKENVCEVQPASASFLRAYPMLQVESHPELDHTSPDDFIDQKYLPLPFLMPPTDPQPLVRFKANVTNTQVVLCVSYFHKALDSTAVSVAIRALAELCKDPNTSPEVLPISASGEELSRQRLLDSAAQYPVPFNWTLTPLTFDPPPEDPDKIPVSHHFKLSAEKITLLKNACNAAISGSEIELPPLTSNDIITALVGLCGNRARLSTVPDYIPPSPKVIIAANVRKQSLLPATYAGNALSAVEASYDASILSGDITLPDGLSASLDPADFTRLANIACNLRKEIISLTESYMSGILRTIAEIRDMTTFFPAYGRSIIVSSLRWMDFYLDFGTLGRVQKYDIPETKVKGVCWVLPAKDTGDVKRAAKQAFELRFVLERVAMEQLKKDRLLLWVLEE